MSPRLRIPPGPDPRAASGQRGLGLLEAIVYAALSLLLIGLAMGGLGTVHKGHSANSEMARLRGDADEAMQVMARDLRNLGLKRVFYESGPGTFVDSLLSGARMGGGDSSSFLHRDGNAHDTLVFLRAGLDRDGRPTGVDTVTYSVDPSGNLLRLRNGEPPAALCGGVEALQFEYGVSARCTTLSDARAPDRSRWRAIPAASLRAAGGSLVAEKSTRGRSVIRVWHDAAFATHARRRYAFDLRVFADDRFLAEVDSVVAMICTPAGAVVASERFLPGTTAQDLRIELDAGPCGDCRAGLAMALRDPGSLVIASFAFSETSRGDPAWTAAPTLAEKQGVRSVRVHLLVRSDRPVHGRHERSWKLANADLGFLDRLGRSHLDEIIPVPNNGH